MPSSAGESHGAHESTARSATLDQKQQEPPAEVGGATGLSDGWLVGLSVGWFVGLGVSSRTVGLAVGLRVGLAVVVSSSSSSHQTLPMQLASQLARLCAQKCSSGAAWSQGAHSSEPQPVEVDQ